MDRNDLHFMQPDLFPDLDWMLQSSQVEDGEILQVIIREHLINLYQFAQVILDDDSLAFSAACDTIVLAVNTRHRYLGEQSGRSWLYALTWKVIKRCSFQRKLKSIFFWRRKEGQVDRISGPKESKSSPVSTEVCRMVQSLTPSRKVILYLSEQMKFSGEEISLINGRKPRMVQKELESLHNRLAALFDGNFSTNLQNLWPVPQFDPDEIEDANELIQKAVSRKEKQALSSRSLKMVGLGAVIFIPILLFLSFSPRLVRDEKRPGKISQEIGTSKTDLSSQRSDVNNLITDEANTMPKAMPPVLIPERTLLEIPDPLNSTIQGESYQRLLTQPGLMSLAAVLQFWQGAWNYPALVQLFNHLIPEKLNDNTVHYDFSSAIPGNSPLYGQLRFGGEPETLKHLLAAGFPVIIQKESQSAATGIGAAQYETVVGFDNRARTFYFLDFTGDAVKPEAVSYAQFVEEWRSFDYAYLVMFPPFLERNYLRALGQDVDGIGN